MADFRNRAEWEKKLADALGKLGDAQRKRLLTALGDPPDPNRLTAEIWQTLSAEMQAELRPMLERVYLDSAEQLLRAVPSVGVDWALVNRRAAEWAKQYTFDLVRGINDNTRAALQEKVSAFYTERLTLSKLRESLEPLYGPVRAEIIAATETTRAAVNGELGVVNELRQAGIAMMAIWNTSNDDIVCPLCGPRNQKRQGDGWSDPPPAHPRCRCWLNHTFKD
jgi:hypothetical protein